MIRKAEPFDNMQFLYGTAHDPFIHCYMELSDHIDEALLKEAVMLTLPAVPQIGSCYHEDTKYPVWEQIEYKPREIVELIACSSRSEDIIADCLSYRIDCRKGPQLKLFILRYEKTDSLCLIMNHMICDGTGYKEYLYLLAKVYTRLCSDHLSDLKELPRSTDQLFNGYSWKDKLALLMSEYHASRKEQQPELHFEGDDQNPFFVTHYIGKEKFKSILLYAKERKVTVNDLLLTAYIRMLHRETGMERIIIPCPVDLRRYLSDPEHQGICNLTSNYFCDIQIQNEDAFPDVLEQISAQMQAQKENNNCLKAVLFLNICFEFLKFSKIQKNFEKLFTVPRISYTNFGVIDRRKVRFGTIAATDLFLTGAVKHIPYFQMAVSTFDDICTLSSNLYGTQKDKEQIKSYLEEIAEDILLEAEGVVIA